MLHPREHALCEDWLEQIQESGYRLTGPRRVIVELLAHSPRAMSPLELYDMGRQEYKNLGLVTVYRTLEKLESLDLIQRVHQNSGCHMYLRAANGHEHILLCTGCGQVQYFGGDNLAELIESTAKQSGFTIYEHWLQLNGLCSVCQEKLQARL